MDNTVNRLQEKYQNEIAPSLLKELGLENTMELPKLVKININVGVGPFKDNKEALQAFKEELTQIAGQSPYETKAKKSEAGFKIKQGDVVGFAVTLRNVKMWAFLDKLINVVLPRVRDFRGLSLTAFDDAGNYNMGIREHSIFPEINPNTIKASRGLQITLVMNSDNKEHNKALLKSLGLPLKKEKNG